MKTYLAAFALATALPVPAAQSTTDVLTCADIVDSAARLECFDRSAAAARGKQAPAAPAAPPVRSPPAAPAAAPVPPPPAAANPADKAASFGDESLKDRAQGTDEALHARIAETRKSGGGRYLIILDNGQVWRHEMGSMAPYLLVGEAVTIRRASMGSYRLTIDAGRSKNWVRVMRVQ